MVALTSLLLASSATSTWTIPEMPCCCAIAGVSGATALIMCSFTLGCAQLGEGVGLGVGGAGEAVATTTVGAVVGAPVAEPRGTPLVEPSVCVFALSADSPVLLLVVLSVLILILSLI